MHRIKIVLGTGFGDEGKGITTDFISTDNSVVVRFSGGHQAGHNVRNEEEIHTFANFGAGTFKGAKTYWSKYCTLHPSGVVAEHEALCKLKAMKNHNLFLNVDSECPVTTHYDILYNRYLEKSRNPHGSCGVGYGQTLQRQEDWFKLHVRDLQYPFIWKERLKLIKEYYLNKFNSLPEPLLKEFKLIDLKKADEHFEQTVESFLKISHIWEEKQFFDKEKIDNKLFIFEGSQGILLDKDYGLFPHVTRSNTTSKNAIEIIGRNFKKKQHLEVYYVTRCYHSRHGQGPMPNEKLPMHTLNFDNELFIQSEVNSNDSHQGEFKIAPIDPSLVAYSINCDKQFLPKKALKHLVITCLDQIKGTHNQSEAVDTIMNELDSKGIIFSHVYGSYSQDAKTMKAL